MKEQIKDIQDKKIKIEAGLQTLPTFTGGFMVYCLNNTDIKLDFITTFNILNKKSIYNYSNTDRKDKDIPAKFKLFLLNSLTESTLNLLMTEYEKINLDKSVPQQKAIKTGKQK
ncbi:MAG: hypothetical protein ACOVNU_03150 [Candidatus Kapaibacteriota bacterium]